MPIEIRELVIRATVQDDAAPTPAGGSTADGVDEETLERMIAEAVRQVLAILAQKEER